MVHILTWKAMTWWNVLTQTTPVHKGAFAENTAGSLCATRWAVRMLKYLIPAEGARNQVTASSSNIPN